MCVNTCVYVQMNVLLYSFFLLPQKRVQHLILSSIVDLYFKIHRIKFKISLMLTVFNSKSKITNYITLLREFSGS